MPRMTNNFWDTRFKLKQDKRLKTNTFFSIIKT